MLWVRGETQTSVVASQGYIFIGEHINEKPPEGGFIICGP